MSTLDWNLKTVPSKTACLMFGGVCSVRGGKVLGGSSVINGMVYSRGNRRDYDLWESFGNSDWNYDSVLPYFKLSENIEIPQLRNSKYHGTNGCLGVGYLRNVSRLRDTFFAAGREMDILNEANDYNGRTQSGMSQTQATIRDGLRCSTNKAFLRPTKYRRNLHITLQSFVTKLIIDTVTKRAQSVQFQRGQREYVVHARKEIILSAGAIHSPQILLLSGIGGAQQLSQFGITVINNLPGVGENLQTHAGFFPLFLTQNTNSNDRLSYNTKDVLTPESIKQMIFEDRGLLLSHPFAETVIFINTKYQNASLDWPDVEIILASGIDFLGVIHKNGTDHDGFIAYLSGLRPYSRGRVYLESSNATEPPLVDGNYFGDERDLKVVVSLRIQFNHTRRFKIDFSIHRSKAQNLH